MESLDQGLLPIDLQVGSPIVADKEVPRTGTQTGISDIPAGSGREGDVQLKSMPRTETRRRFAELLSGALSLLIDLAQMCCRHHRVPPIRR